MNNSTQKFVTILLLFVLALAGCKDFFHPLEPATYDEPGDPADPITVTVSYNANGGSGTAPGSQTVNAGSSVTVASGSGLSKSGYTFSGWNTTADSTGTAYEAGASMTVTANTTLYAQWTDPAALYTVSYNANGGGGTLPASQTVNGGSSITVAGGSGLSRSDYTFSGWNTVADGTGGAYAAGASLLVNSGLTLYAQWAVIVQYTVSYSANGGSGTAPGPQTVNAGSIVTVASESGLTYVGRTFDSWNTNASGMGNSYAAGASLMVTANTTLYAHWASAIPVPDTLSLAESLIWVTNNAVDGGAYVITLRNNESIAPRTLSYDGRNVTVILSGGTAEKTISLSGGGSLFTLYSRVTLMLDNNVTLQGRSNSRSLVSVSGGTLIMKGGSKIKGNTSASTSSSYGGGVNVSSGTFTMAGGEISGNTATATATTTTTSSSYGGGVNVSGGTFTMAGGEISGNTSTTTITYTSTNTASSYGGGVNVSGGTFTMAGGEISGNTATATGTTYPFYTASSYGGGVNVSGGTFTMAGGEISGNTGTATVTGTGTGTAGTASSYGGGVYTNSNGTFTKTSGVIYGSNISDALKNTVSSNNNGHAVYVNSSPTKKRNTTAGISVNLDSRVGGTAANWE
ncbi:hypothetical protein AGMMS49546_03190 [Spirochaetia bacterium]|nr:hypothetical protein AGMMS49546_03190 [Spirochaetia bacterium]